MNKQQTDLLKYLGTEETNLLVSMMRFRTDIDGFHDIDELFQEPASCIDIKVKDFDSLTNEERHSITVAALYSFMHYHLYFSTTCLLRCHLSDSLASTRKAIDAAFTGYKLIREPGTLNDYVEGAYAYKFIKKHITKARQRDASLYPLAPPLIELHEICSEFGSHADVGSFVSRVAVERTGVNKLLFNHLMFQIPNDPLEQRCYILQTYHGFVLMALIFADFIGNLTSRFDAAGWKTRLEDMQTRLERVLNKCSAELHKRADGAATGPEKESAETDNH